MTDQSCRYRGKNNPRVLPTHLPDCERATCEGCFPCLERHCQLCGRAHVTVDGNGADQTCAACVGTVRSNGDTIVTLTGRMLTEAMHKGINSDAAVYAGPIADIEAWTWRKIAANKAGVDWADIDDDDTHPSWVVGTWEMLVREHYQQPTTDQMQLADAWDYLDGHLTRLAQDDKFAFEELARDLQQCVTRLENVLHDGVREERGAPCPMCGKGALIKDYGKNADDDIRWKCDRRGCGQWYTDRDYREKVDATYIRHADRLTASQMHVAHRVPEGSVRAWASKDKVRKMGRDQNGLTLYSVEDVLKIRDARILATVPEDRVA